MTIAKLLIAKLLPGLLLLQMHIACGAAEVPESSSGVDATSMNAGTPKVSEYDKLPLAQLAALAKGNDARAQFELGSRFNYGRGQPKNVREAVRWLRRAAENGDHDAQRLLALKFYSGYDVPVDFDESLKWTQRLAEAGDVPAQLALGNMYASGEGTARNLVRAYMWYDIAAASAEEPQRAATGVAAAAEAPAEGKSAEEPDAEKLALAENRKNAAKRAVGLRSKIGSLLLPDQEAEAQQLSSNWWLQQQGVDLEERKPASPAIKGRKGH